MKKNDTGPFEISPQQYSYMRNLMNFNWKYGEQHAYPVWMSFLLWSEWDEKSEYLHENPSVNAFEIPLEGDMILEVDGVETLVRHGELLVLPAGIPNRLRTGPAGRCRKISFGICGVLAQSMLAQLGLDECGVFLICGGERFFSLLDSIAKILGGKATEDAPRAFGLTMELLALIAEQNGKRSSIPRKLSDALRIVEYNFVHGLSVSELADILKISRKKLFLLFRDEFGKSPREFISDLRLNQASRMLLSNETPIKNIASRSGYASGNTFTREFRKHFGMSPREFRKKKRL